MNGTAQIPVNFAFNILGPPLSSSDAPDLAVDGQGAQQSVQISDEDFSATDCDYLEGCVRGTGTRRLLRFDGAIENLGGGDLVLGAPANNPLFTYDSCHGHFHLKDIMKNELLSADTKQPVVVGSSSIVSYKEGFCMEDVQQVAGNQSGKFSCTNQGITSGWEDVYDASLDCQWLDITDVQAGNYILRITVNPDGTFFESDTSNNSVEIPVTIPGAP